MKNTEEQLKEHTDLAREAIISNDAPGARRLAKDLSSYVKQKGFKRSEPEIFARYSGIIAKLKWISLPLMKKEEALALFEENFQEALSTPYLNLKNKLIETMLVISDLEERDLWKKDIKEIINRNGALLTKTNLKNGKRGTVENWIKSYVSAIGLGIADPVKFENYFVAGEDTNFLPIEEVSRLKDFFFFYEYLKSSSLTIKGLEDRPLVKEGEDFGILENGGVTMLRPSKAQEEIAALVDKILSPAPAKPVAVEAPKAPASVPVPKPLSAEEKQKETDKLRLEEQKKRQILDLEKMAKASLPGSLERKAIEEEKKKFSS